MHQRSIARIVSAGLCLVLLTGCGQTFFPDALPLDLEQLDEIRNDSTLEPQEKRDALAALGVDQVTINGLLQSERLANQFGGDLASAIDKVDSEQMASMTPDEVQFYGDATDVTTYGDNEAAAIVRFFVDNSISKPADITAFLDDPATELPSEIDQTNLTGVFVDTSIDDVRDKLP